MLYSSQFLEIASAKIFTISTFYIRGALYKNNAVSEKNVTGEIPSSSGISLSPSSFLSFVSPFSLIRRYVVDISDLSTNII